MLKEGVARLPVMRGIELVGIVARADIVQGVGMSYDSKTEGETP
jgi:CBS domain-containing protein